MWRTAWRYCTSVWDWWTTSRTTDTAGGTDFVLVRRPRGTVNTSTRKQHIPKPLRDQVWTFYVGPTFQVSCPCCSSVNIDALHFECGHVLAEAAGGATHLVNLRPICKACNASMGRRHMHEFMKACGFSLQAMCAMDAKAATLLGHMPT